jgi:hypothetical protein
MRSSEIIMIFRSLMEMQVMRSCHENLPATTVIPHPVFVSLLSCKSRYKEMLIFKSLDRIKDLKKNLL